MIIAKCVYVCVRACVHVSICVSLACCLAIIRVDYLASIHKCVSVSVSELNFVLSQCFCWFVRDRIAPQSVQFLPPFCHLSATAAVEVGGGGG